MKKKISMREGDNEHEFLSNDVMDFYMYNKHMGFIGISAVTCNTSIYFTSINGKMSGIYVLMPLAIQL
jgi:hypothetical protein